MILEISTEDSTAVKVFLKKEGKVVAELSQENQRGSQVLLPMIVQIMRENDVHFKDLTGMEVHTGPGSFVGLRVGVSVAQAMGFALGIPVNGKKSQKVEVIYQ